MNASTTEYPLKTVQVIEKEHGASRSSFHCETGSSAKRMRMSVSSSDSECCTKALRLVSGSDSAIHPRDWPTTRIVDSAALIEELSFE
jgi:hypothetical protein